MPRIVETQESTQKAVELRLDAKRKYRRFSMSEDQLRDDSSVRTEESIDHAIIQKTKEKAQEIEEKKRWIIL